MAPPLPDTLERSHDEIRKLYEENQAFLKENQAFREKNQAFQKENQIRLEEIERLRHQISVFQKYIFGSRSERRAVRGASADTLTADLFAPQPEATPQEIAEETSKPREEPRKRNRTRRPLPADLRIDKEVLDVPDGEKACPCCGKERPVIGEDVTDLLELIPAQVYVKRIVRLRRACPSCKEGVAQAALPPQPITRGLAGPGLLAWLAVAKYCDHLPLCRMERIFKRHGIEITRNRMCDWLMKMADLARPLLELMRRKIPRCAVVQADETPLQVQTLEKKGKTQKAWLWAYLGDAAAPYTVYDFRMSRSGGGPLEMLETFHGTLLTDAWSAYDKLAPPRPEPNLPPGVARAGCWAHARRYFVKARDSGCAAAEEALDLIGRLYGVEKELSRRAKEEKRALSPEEIVAARQEKSAPVCKMLYEWTASRMDALPKSPLGEAVTYCQNNKPALERYLFDGRLPIDNSASERAMRPVALGRHNWLFAGSERGGRAAAAFFTLIESARRHELNPWLYLKDLFTRLPGHPVNRLEELLPDVWKPAKAPQTDAPPSE